MDNDFYSLAYKAGIKQQKEDIAKGKDGFLPALDAILSVDKLALGSDLGIVQIPAEQIIGTKNVGRCHTFASNFMPVAEENSEFASKWKNLCCSHLEEGIRDPVKAYEYKNQYYIEEGNKRVSVLKFFEAVTISGQVIRILPERDGSEDVELYYEFAEFYEISKVNFILFSKKGSYRKFLQLLGRERANDWDDDVVHKLRTDYYYFKKAFLDQGGAGLEITPADAMLRFMMIYGYDALRGKGQQEIREILQKAWKEIVRIPESDPINIIEDPAKETNSGLLSKIIPGMHGNRKNLRALFLYNRTPETSYWISGHEKGRLLVQERMDGQLRTETAICASEEESEQIMREAIDRGVNVIFATASEMLHPCLKVAIDYPQTAILNCSLNVQHRYIRTYYPRMYEAKFISGAIAGAMCRNDKIGYITNYPVYGNIAEVNAFARGVQLSNSHAKVYLEWATDSTLQKKAMELIHQGIRLISVRNRSENEGEERELFGLQQVADGKITELVAPVWNWGAYYEQILHSIQDGSYWNQESRTSQSLNYYWGMSSNVVDICFSEALPRSTRYLGELIQKAIRMGVCRPFYEPKLDDSGHMEWHNIKATLSMEEIIGMDWLEPNIVGSIPSYEQLPEQVKKLVDVIGVKPARKDPDELL